MIPSAAPDPAPLPPEWAEVVEVLCSDPLGTALWDRARLSVVARRQAERITQLEEAVRATPAPVVD